MPAPAGAGAGAGADGDVELEFGSGGEDWPVGVVIVAMMVVYERKED